MSKKRLRPASAADKFLQTATTEQTEETTVSQLNENIGNKEIVEKNLNIKGDNNIIEEKKEELSQQRPKIGQPKKYAEPTKHISFSFPVSVIENLKILAGLKKTNQTQLILSLIKSELEKENTKIEAYKNLLI